LDQAIADMLASDRTTVLDVAIDQQENCFPMIPGGAAHNEIMLGPEDRASTDPSAREEGMVLV
jgi:acetolactate synthase-1/2/3 large subunit